MSDITKAKTIEFFTRFASVHHMFRTSQRGVLLLEIFRVIEQLIRLIKVNPGNDMIIRGV